MDERRSLLGHRRSESEPKPGNARKVKVAQGAILLTVALERLAFYSLTGNLVLFLNRDPYAWRSYNALYCTFVFLGISYVLSFVGGIIADTLLGKFKTLLFAFVIYLVGYIFLPVVTNEDNTVSPENNTFLQAICGKFGNSDGQNGDMSLIKSQNDKPLIEENCAALIFGILTIIAVGSGIFRSVIAPFGADQVRGEGPQTSLAFFNWYYWSINLGTLVALSVVTYIQQDYRFFYGFLSSNICLGLSCLVFITGCWTYIYVPKTGSILTNIFKIFFESCQRRRMHRHRENNVEHISADASDIPEFRVTESSPSFLDRAKYRFGGSFHETAVEDVKQLLKILCVFMTLLPYWMVYFQMQTTFELQGLHMKLDMSNTETYTFCYHNYSSYTPQLTSKKTLVAAWFTLFDVIFLILLLPLFDRVIYPYLKKHDRPVGIVCRISIGMMFATAAVMVAGVVELFRLKQVWPDEDKQCCSTTINQTIGHTVYRAADMSVFWQIPQYALIGISEVFTSVAALEFAYQMAPKSMKGIIMGFFYLFTGIGSLLGTGTMFAFKGTWFFQEDFGNINCRIPCNDEKGTFHHACHLDYYFFFLAGLEFLGMFVFISIAKRLRLSQHLVPVSKTSTLDNVTEKSFAKEREDPGRTTSRRVNS